MSCSLWERVKGKIMRRRVIRILSERAEEEDAPWCSWSTNNSSAERLFNQTVWMKKRSYSPDSGGNIWTFPIMIPLEKIWVAAILEPASELLSSQSRWWATPTSSLLSMKQIFLHSHWHWTYSQKLNSACNKTVYLFLNWELILIYGHWLESTVLGWCSANRAQKQETQQNGAESAGRPGF